jgi:organic radical activating enzyme
MTYPLAKDGVFWTLQGEGAQQGEPMVFVRLAGCSVGCPECDTDYKVVRRVTTEELVGEIRQVVPRGFQHPWVWLTGGEPTDHDLGPLIDLLATTGFRVALATSGVRLVPMPWVKQINWLSVSPHAVTAVQKFGHELKVVPGLNGLSWADMAVIDAEWHSFPWRYVQPLWGSDGMACINFVQTHPGWRMTAQAHKAWLAGW